MAIQVEFFKICTEEILNVFLHPKFDTGAEACSEAVFWPVADEKIKLTKQIYYDELCAHLLIWICLNVNVV